MPCTKCHRPRGGSSLPKIHLTGLAYYAYLAGSGARANG